MFQLDARQDFEARNHHHKSEEQNTKQAGMFPKMNYPLRFRLEVPKSLLLRSSNFTPTKYC